MMMQLKMQKKRKGISMSETVLIGKELENGDISVEIQGGVNAIANVLVQGLVALATDTSDSRAEGVSLITDIIRAALENLADDE